MAYNYNNNEYQQEVNHIMECYYSSEFDDLYAFLESIDKLDLYDACYYKMLEDFDGYAQY